MRQTTCYCHNCKREFHPLGIARHRAMHRDRDETVTITFSNGITLKYEFGERRKGGEK